MACSKCPPGNFGLGDSVCFTCVPGTYSDIPGLSSCIGCEAGTFTSAVAANASYLCIGCLPGQFASFEGSSVCLACYPGTYSDVLSLSSCIACSAGKFSSIQRANSSQVCLNCPPGQYSPIDGTTNCSSCDLGKYSSAPGTSSCNDCPKGTCTLLSSANNLMLCVICSPFMDSFNSLESSSIASATYNNNIAEPGSANFSTDCGNKFPVIKQKRSSQNRIPQYTNTVDQGLQEYLSYNAQRVFGADQLIGWQSMDTVDEADTTCSRNNTAVYGDCIASPYNNLLVLGIPTKDNPAYSGLAFSFAVYKKDIYNQTIVSDSSSLLQISTSLNQTTLTDTAVAVLGKSVARLNQGVATFTVQIKPTYVQVLCEKGITILKTSPFIYIYGLDSEDSMSRMQSSFFPVVLSEGFNVCPKGYILTLDSQNLGMGAGQCQWCPAGTYSVLSLAGKDGLSNESVPSCLNCPAGGNCLQGGFTVSFLQGEWRLDTDQYRLIHCPVGTQLINSSDGTSKGSYSHDRQQCKLCLENQYILNPDTDLCQMCPPGLSCDGSDAVIAYLNESSWVKNGSVYLLTGCPIGYSVSSVGVLGTFDATVQQCRPCQKGEECVSAPCLTCSPCSAGYFKPLIGIEECMPCPSNTFNSKQGAQDQSECQPCRIHASTQGRIAQISQASCICDDQYYAQSSLFNYQCIKCPNGATCSDNTCALKNTSTNVLQCLSGEGIVGYWTLESISGEFQLEGCPAGNFLYADECQLCPAAFYCTGGKMQSTPCGSDQFSFPGARDRNECSPSVFVVVVINIGILRPYFSGQMTEKFQNSLAASIDVNPESLIVEVVQAGNDATTTDITSKIATVDAYEADLLAKRFYSSDFPTNFDMFASGIQSAAVLSVKVTACTPGYELETQPPPSLCRLCPPDYYCSGGAKGRLPCPGGGFSIGGSSGSSACTSFAVILDIYLPISQNNFTVHAQSLFLIALEKTVGLVSGNISIVLVKGNSRASLSVLQVSAEIPAVSSAEATDIIANVDASVLNNNLLAEGLPESTFISHSLKSSYPQVFSEAPSQTATILGVSLGCTAVCLLLSAAGYVLFTRILKQRDYKTFINSITNSKKYDIAPHHAIPSDLRKEYKAESCLGKGGYGCVIKAKENISGANVAVKIILPEKGTFNEKEIKRFNRETSTLRLFASRKCEYAVNLAVGSRVAEFNPFMGWFVLEFLEGEDLDSLVHPQHTNEYTLEQAQSQSDRNHKPIDHIECIKVARCVLAALKVIHSEGVIHRDIKPANIVRCLQDSYPEKCEGWAAFYKLIDFGSAVGIDEAVATDIMLTLAGNRATPVGTPPYMSPEMFKEPERAAYPTDIWSLGVTMFEIVTGQLPFISESDLLWGYAIAGNLEATAPDVLDLIQERRSTFDHNLCKVIAKALKKQVQERFASADEMHEAVYCCLIERGEACYSAFISYRVASEAPLARLLFDELNHSITPNGHRVTVYWDAYRLVNGEDWEDGFANGLLHSACFFPLLSFGSTAPLAALSAQGMSNAIADGWGATPVNRKRLTGAESDVEDNFLKELLIAAALLNLSKSPAGIQAEILEKVELKLAYPILVGRQHPKGHPDFPYMGSFFDVQGGGGCFPDCPSPPTARVVARFLQEKACFTSEAADKIKNMSVAEAVATFTRLQGCQLWNHSKVLT